MSSMVFPICKHLGQRAVNNLLCHVQQELGEGLYALHLHQRFQRLRLNEDGDGIELGNL